MQNKGDTMKKKSAINPICKEMIKIVQPQNKIVERLQSQIKCNPVIDPREGYSRMHSRHNRS